MLTASTPSPRPLGPSLLIDSTQSNAWLHASDTELAKALQAGAADAHSAAWRRFFPMVSGMARRRLGGSADVDDVIQEAFLAVFRSIQRLREPGALRAFVLTITARILNREVRRRVSVNAVTAWNEAPEGVSRDEADPAARHAYAVLGRFVERLRVREKRAFTLHYVAGMNAAEMADALGVSMPTARRILSSARRRLEVWAGRDPFLADYLEMP